MKDDFAVLQVLVNLVAWLFPDFQYVWLAEETKKNLPLELDFLNEGRNCERVGRMFKHFSFLKVKHAMIEKPMVIRSSYHLVSSTMR